MKIVIDENEIVYLNDKKIESEQLNSEFLESVVYNGLDSKLDLENSKIVFGNKRYGEK